MARLLLLLLVGCAPLTPPPQCLEAGTMACRAYEACRIQGGVRKIHATMPPSVICKNGREALLP